MALDLGALIARVVLEDAEFQVKVRRVVAELGTIGREAGTAAAGTGKLDESLAATGASGDKAAAGIGRAAKAEADAAAAAARHAAATARVTEAMAATAGASTRVQTATLRQIAAEDRLAATQESGAATTRQLAGAQAGLIAASDRVAASQAAAAASTSRWRGALAGTLRTAAGLGITLGAFEAVKKAIDIGKEASQFQQDMLLIKTQAGATGHEVAWASKQVLALAGPVASAPDQLANSMYHAVSVGLHYSKALDTVRIAAEGAKVGHADLEQTTNAMTATVASGIGGVRNMSSAMGQLNAIVGAGDMKLSDLNDALGTGLLTAMRTFGVSLTETGAALAVFGDNNIRGRDAATLLRMSVMDLSKPAAHADDVLSKIGLTSAKLRENLSEHGLSGALNDLAQRLHAAGITGDQVGGFLEDAFTKKAGRGLATLVEEVDRYNLKIKQVTEGGASFASRWRATTQTVGFQFQRIGAEVQSALIGIAEKSQPAFTSMAHWLGTTLPHAASTFWHAIQPVAQVVGGALVGAWRVLSPLLRIAGSALMTVARAAAGMPDVLRAVTITALGLWAAFKGYRIATAALTALDGGLGRLVLKANAAYVAVAANAGAFAPLGLAVAGVTAIAYFGVKAFQDYRQHQQMIEQETGNLTQALTASKGAFDAQARAVVANSLLMEKGALTGRNTADLAGQLGVSLQSVTSAVIQGGPALESYRRQLEGIAAANQTTMTTTGPGGYAQQVRGYNATGQAAKDLLRILGEQNNVTGVAAKHARDLAAATMTDAQAQKAANAARAAGNKLIGAPQAAVAVARQATAAARAHAQAAANDADAARAGTAAYRANSAQMQGGVGPADAHAAAIRRDLAATKAAAEETANLNAALKGLDSVFSRVGAQLAYQQSLIDLRKALHDNKGAMDDHTAAGIADRQAILSAAQNALAYAQTLTTQRDGAHKAAAAIQGVADQIRSSGEKAHMSQGQIHSMLAELHLTPHDITTNFHLDTTQPVNALANLRRLAAEGLDMNLRVHPTTSSALAYGVPALTGGQANFPRNAKGTGEGVLPKGIASVGEEGPELAVTDDRGTAILSNRDSRKFLRMTGMKAPGFAGGTLPGNGSAIASFLAGKGLNAAAIAGILGNLWAESSFRSSAYNAHEGAIGIAQWEGSRRTALQNFTHGHETSLGGQLAYLWQELTGPYRGVLSALRNAHDPRQAAANFDANFERSTGSSRGLRMSAAARFFGAHMPGGSSSGGGGGNAAVQAANQARATAVGSASSAIGAVNAIPGGSRFSMDTFNQRTYFAQISQANAAIAAARAAGASSATLGKLRDYLRGITTEGTRFATALRQRVTREVVNLAHVLTDPTQGALAGALATFNADFRRVGASAKQLDNLTASEAKLTTVRGRLLQATTQLAAMNTYRSGVRNQLLGQFDPTQAGSVQDLEAGFHGATGSANVFAGQIARLRREGLDKSFLTRLIQAGPNATLGTLASANLSQIRNVNRDLATYRTAIGGAADNAVMQQYGISIPGQQTRIGGYEQQGAAVLDTLAKALDRPIYLTLDGHVVARYVAGSKELAAMIHQIGDALGAGRATSRR